MAHLIPLNEGYTYTRGNTTPVSPVKICQPVKPIPSGLNISAPKTTGSATHPQKSVISSNANQ